MTNIAIYRRGTAALVALFALLAICMSAGAAVAQTEPYGGGQPTVSPTVIRDEDTVEPDVLGQVETRDEGTLEPGARSETEVEGGALPFTGGDLVLFVIIGTAAIAGGTWMYRHGTRKA